MEISSAGGTKETSVRIAWVSFKKQGTSGRKRQAIVLGHSEDYTPAHHGSLRHCRGLSVPHDSENG